MIPYFTMSLHSSPRIENLSNATFRRRSCPGTSAYKIVERISSTVMRHVILWSWSFVVILSTYKLNPLFWINFSRLRVSRRYWWKDCTKTCWRHLNNVTLLLCVYRHHVELFRYIWSRENTDIDIDDRFFLDVVLIHSRQGHSHIIDEGAFESTGLDLIIVNVHTERITHDPSTRRFEGTVTRVSGGLDIQSVPEHILIHRFEHCISAHDRLKSQINKNGFHEVFMSHDLFSECPRSQLHRMRLDIATRKASSGQQDTDARCRTFYLMKKMQLNVSNQQECHLNKWSLWYLRKRFVMILRSSVKMSRTNIFHSTTDWSMIKRSVHSVESSPSYLSFWGCSTV